MKLVLVINFLVLITIAFGKPTNDEYDPEFGAEDTDMQNDDYGEGDYDEDSNDDGDEEDDVAPEILSKGQIFTVEKHENILLPCDMVGNHAMVTMWKKKDDILFQDKIPLGNVPHDKYSLKNTSLFIKNVDENDAGEYTCLIIMAVNVPMIVHTLKLKTQASILNIYAAKNVNEYKTGDTLMLTCNATGEPEPKIIWSLDGKRFPVNGKTLIVENLGRDNSGNYQCFAENGVGTPVHQFIHVQVNYKPSVRIVKSMTSDDGKDFSAELRCMVESHPRAIVTWRKDGEVINSENTKYKFRNKNNAHAIDIRHMKEADFGKYTCTASNQEGKNEHHYILTDRPSQPLFKQGEQLDNNRSVYLVWEVDSFFPISEHSLMFKKKDAEEWSQVSPIVTNGVQYIYMINHTISNLEHGDYVAKVKSKNKAGWSEESKERKFSGPKHKQHHGNNKNHYIYDKANEHNIQEAPEIAQTRSQATGTNSTTMLAPSSLLYLIVLMLFNSRRDV